MKPGRLLIEMNLAEARRTKWARGQAEHGTLMQNDPLLELYDELVDGLNYIPQLIGNEAGQFPPDSYSASRLRSIRAALILSATNLQQIFQVSRDQRGWTPRTAEFGDIESVDERELRKAREKEGGQSRAAAAD